MEVYQDLKIYLQQDQYQDYVADLKKLLIDSDWRVREDLSANFRNNSFSLNKITICIETPLINFEGKNLKGIIWIWDYSGYLELFNITSMTDIGFDFKEYNYILNCFYSSFVIPLKSKYAGDIILSSSQTHIEETIGEDAYIALVAFSEGANKSTGNSHPFDFERWCEFVFLIFRNKIELSVDELIDWLKEKGWCDDMAYKLGLEFEYSLRLLQKYEQNR